MNISDDQLSNWTKPWFNNEEDRAERTKETVKKAVDNHPKLKNLSIRVFAKGSYPNNTNVRKNSDIDIAVEFKQLVRLSYAEGVVFSDTELSEYEGISENQLKSYLGEALNAEFEETVDHSGNKVFKIRGSDKIMDADIIPCTTFRHYYSKDPESYQQGIQLILDNPDGAEHSNYPDQHLENGVDKNTSTMKRFKSVVRILKNVNNYLVKSDGSINYPSFMIECLAYNVSNSVYNGDNTWRDIILRGCEDVLAYLKIEEHNHSESGRWLEVNKCKYLFHSDQIWTRSDAKQFVKNIYNLLDN